METTKTIWRGILCGCTVNNLSYFNYIFSSFQLHKCDYYPRRAIYQIRFSWNLIHCWELVKPDLFGYIPVTMQPRNSSRGRCVRSYILRRNIQYIYGKIKKSTKPHQKCWLIELKGDTNWFKLEVSFELHDVSRTQQACSWDDLKYGWSNNAFTVYMVCRSKQHWGGLGVCWTMHCTLKQSYETMAKCHWNQVGTQRKGGWHCASLLHGKPLQLHTLRKTATLTTTTTTTTTNCRVKLLVTWRLRMPALNSSMHCDL